MYKIYILIDPFTHQVRYVGQTVRNLQVRLKHHSYGSKNTHIINWVKSILKKSAKPIIEQIDSCEDSETCDDLERFWIAYFRFIGARLANLSKGGQSLSPEELELFNKKKKLNGRRMKSDFCQSQKNKDNYQKLLAHWKKTQTPEVRKEIGKKISISSKGKKASEEALKNIRIAALKRKGIPRTEEVKRKIGLKHKGKKLSHQQIEFLRKINTGKKLHPEHCAKISKANKGKIFSESHRKKLSESQKGRKLSEKQRLQMSVRMKGKPAWNKGLKTGKPAWNTGLKTGKPAWNAGIKYHFKNKRIKKQKNQLSLF